MVRVRSPCESLQYCGGLLGAIALSGSVRSPYGYGCTSPWLTVRDRRGDAIALVPPIAPDGQLLIGIVPIIRLFNVKKQAKVAAFS